MAAGPRRSLRTPTGGAASAWSSPGRGGLAEGGTTYQNLGLRYKGNASYMASARGLKRNLKIELNRHKPGQRYYGLKTLNLNAGAMDVTKGREALSYAVFRAAGVPAPRTAFAEVTLTVPGKYDRELLGLYTVIEQVDRTFLEDRFGDGKGLLLKPERACGVEYLGDDWAPYRAAYQPRHAPTPEEARRFIAFARLVHQADDEQFRKEVGSYLDVDEFLRFVAVNALLVNLDSILVMGHNYYIYLNPKTNQFVFIPWDMDLSLAGFPMAGPPERQMELSLAHPHAGVLKLLDRLLAVKDVRARYEGLLKELAATCFTKERLLRDLDAIEIATKDAKAREAKVVEARHEERGGFGPPGGVFGRAPDLRTFVGRRTASVADQLAGKSKGYEPQVGFGPGGPGPFGGPPQPGQVLPPFLQGALRLTADQKKQLEALQKRVEARLGEILTDEQRKALDGMRGGFGPGGPPGLPRPPGFGPPPGGAPPGPPDD